MSINDNLSNNNTISPSSTKTRLSESQNMGKLDGASLPTDTRLSKFAEVSPISGEQFSPTFPVLNPKKTHTHILTKPVSSSTTSTTTTTSSSLSPSCEISTSLDNDVKSIASQLLEIFETAILRGDKDKHLVSRIKKFLNKYDEKNDQILKYIHQGERFACCLGFFYEFGILVPVDHAKALSLYQKSAINDPIGQFCLGLCFYEEKGVSKIDSKSLYPKDEKECYYWMKKSAEAGCTRGQCSLGYCYVKGIGVKKDETKSLYWFQRSAEGGCALGQANFGLSHEKGIGCAIDKEKAFYYYGLSARGGNSKGQCCLGLCYDEGIGCEQDKSTAFYWYSQSAYGGNTDGQYYCANCYLNNTDIKDERKAHYWYKNAANEGDTDGMCMLGYCQRYGWGTSRDVHEAIKTYRQAGKHGNKTASEALITLFYVC